MTQGVQILLFICVILSNLIFVSLWGYALSKNIKTSIRKNNKKLYICCCLRGKAELFEKISLQQNTNEILKNTQEKMNKSNLF